MSDLTSNDENDAKASAGPPPDGATLENAPKGATNGTSPHSDPKILEESADADAKSPAKSEETPLFAKGNPLRKARGGLTALLGGFAAYLLMAHNGQLSFGVPLGIVFVAIATWGVMDFVGSFDDERTHATTDRLAQTTTLTALRQPLITVVIELFLFGGALAGGQSGWGSQWAWGAVVTLLFLVLVQGVFRLGVALGPFAKDEFGLARPLWRRHGFWVVAAGAILYFPAMGIFSLWDPWETHYGEVAREILSRDDWISLWWAQDGWFWSKPILNFWIQAIAMASLGTHYHPDQMLNGFGGPTAHPEWVVRAPNVLMTIVAMYVLYKGVAKVFGRRAGLIGGIVLATMPDWYFLAHQTMTDMPFVAAMTAAMGLFLLGLHTDEEAKAKLYEIKAGSTTWRVSGWHLAFGAILICAIPQILYLFSRNLELVLHGEGAHGFRVHYDEFRSGSAGNCGLPGNEACNLTAPASIPHSVGPHPDGLSDNLIRFFGGFEPLLQAVIWAVVLGLLLYMNWGERRVRRLFYIGAWFCAAIATMGKGPAGFALPMICAFAYVATKKRWSELLRVELVSGILIIGAVALPWYIAMYVRHGSPFTDRLIFHDMFNRAFGHVHDTNEGDDTSFRFYIWQLGYALFPWTALAPLGLIYWLRKSDSADHGKGDASVFLAWWFLFAFALFSFMGTKFHHYIFPAVPPVAMLIGVVIDDMIGARPLARRGDLAIYVTLLTLGIGVTVFGVARCFPGSIFGDKDHTMMFPASVGLGAVLFLVGGAITAFAIMKYRAGKNETFASLGVGGSFGGYRESPVASASAKNDESARAAHEHLMIGAAAVGGAIVLALTARDLVIKPDGADQPGAIRFLQLFTYNYRRPWPDSLDFSSPIAAIAIVAILLMLLLAVQKLRRHAAAGLVALSFVAAVWGLDVYMVKTSPHWGQHEIMETYYAQRAGTEEPLVAYQMNWKGENFYTGNHIPAFVSSGAAFTKWLKEQREKGIKVMYFVTEHSRVNGLRGEVGAKTLKEVTDKVLNNKFVLVRAEL